MANRKISFINDNYYHIYNRGIDKRIIFENDHDFKRFQESLRLFNSPNSIWLADANQKTEVKPQDRLVDIVCYCLMPNHFHLLLKQRVDSGIPNFMRKLGTGYSLYFNMRKERSGSLFQGTYKAKLVTDDNYLTHLSRYIHMNPVELVDSNWKVAGIKNKRTAFDFLDKFQWSSYPDFISEVSGKIISRSILHEMFTPSSYKKFIESWLIKDLEQIAQLPWG